jgi:hypothetical protein
VAASAVSVAGASAAARGNPFQLWPPSGGGVTSDYLTYQTSEIRVTADKSSSRWLPVANYLPRLTAGCNANSAAPHIVFPKRFAHMSRRSRCLAPVS